MYTVENIEWDALIYKIVGWDAHDKMHMLRCTKWNAWHDMYKMKYKIAYNELIRTVCID